MLTLLIMFIILGMVCTATYRNIHQQEVKRTVLPVRNASKVTVLAESYDYDLHVHYEPKHLAYTPLTSYEIVDNAELEERREVVREYRDWVDNVDTYFRIREVIVC